MARFRFRAQAALDLRVRQHEDALRVLARAEADRLEASARVEAAARAVIDAQRTGDEMMRAGKAGADLHWHRMWIVRLDHERAAAAVSLAAREAAVTEARASSLAARQRRESLERFRGKLHDAHVELEAETERKMLDELATRRFALRGGGHAPGPGEQAR